MNAARLSSLISWTFVIMVGHFVYSDQDYKVS